MSIKVGDKLPSVTLTQATADGPKPIASDDFFGGKTVALFAPPARRGTCRASSTRPTRSRARASTSSPACP